MLNMGVVLGVIVGESILIAVLFHGLFRFIYYYKIKLDVIMYRLYLYSISCLKYDYNKLVYELANCS